MSQNEGVVIDTPEGIAHFQMASAIARLKLEVNTGMNASRSSTLRFVRAQYGIEAGTKKKALRLMEELYAKTYGREYGSKVEVKDERLFLDQQSGRIACLKHLGGYGKSDVTAFPEGTSRTIDGRRQWMTPLDVWMQLEQEDIEAMLKPDPNYPDYVPTAHCEDCGPEVKP